MGNFIHLLKLLLPFLREYGLLDTPYFLFKNKYFILVLLCATAQFISFLYAIDQAHTRMLKEEELNEKIIYMERVLQIENTTVEEEYKNLTGVTSNVQ